MNKKGLLSLVLSALIIMPSVVYAEGFNSSISTPNNGQVAAKFAPDEKPDKQINETIKGKGQDKKQASGEKKQEASERKAGKKEQIEAFKIAMREKHVQMKTLRLETIALRQEIEKKTEELLSIMDDIQSGKKALTEEMMKELLAAMKNIKLDTKEIKETSEISAEAKETEAKTKGAEFNNALASMDKVIAKYQRRLDALKQLNTDLDKSLAIARLAVKPAPAEKKAPAAEVTKAEKDKKATTPATTDNTAAAKP